MFLIVSGESLAGIQLNELPESSRDRIGGLLLTNRMFEAAMPVIGHGPDVDQKAPRKQSHGVRKAACQRVMSAGSRRRCDYHIALDHALRNRHAEPREIPRYSGNFLSYQMFFCACKQRADIQDFVGNEPLGWALRPAMHKRVRAAHQVLHGRSSPAKTHSLI